MLGDAQAEPGEDDLRLNPARARVIDDAPIPVPFLHEERHEAVAPVHCEPYPRLDQEQVLHGDVLEIGTVLARGLDAPFLEAVGDVSDGLFDAGNAGLPPLHGIVAQLFQHIHHVCAVVLDELARHGRKNHHQSDESAQPFVHGHLRSWKELIEGTITIIPTGIRGGLCQPALRTRPLLLPLRAPALTLWSSDELPGRLPSL